MHADTFLRELDDINAVLPADAIEQMAVALHAIQRLNRAVYTVGLGGSLANCIHFAADLRKLCGIDARSPSNMAELTAWSNDVEWAALFDGYLCNMTPKDALFVLSVGGGTDTVSTPITVAVRAAKALKVPIFGIVGPNGGETARLGDYVIKIPAIERITPHTEAFQMIIAHCLVSHPLLQIRKAKW